VSAKYGKEIGVFVLPLRDVLFKTKKKQQQANKKTTFL
jgi:hypothetical protein